MMRFIKQSWASGVIVAAWGLACGGVVHAETVAQPTKTAPSAGAPIERIMESLIDYKAFRWSSKDFDQVVAPYCKRTEQRQYGHGVDAEYQCDAATGISEMKISTQENAAASTSYMMYIQVALGPDRYAPLKMKMQNKLGKPKNSAKDFVRYVYNGDKELSKRGTPVISLAREDEETVVFEIGLEQGP